MMKRCALFTLALLAGTQLQAQLAITEVMASASTNQGPALVTQGSDFWELTNFGTNTVDLTGYRFDDADNNLEAADSTPFDGLSIAPGKSILFVQTDTVTNADQFRAWWGNLLPADAQIAFYSGNGLSSGGDGLRLWDPVTTDVNDVVDKVDFSAAQRGFTFVYNPLTGFFGDRSTNGVGGAGKAEASDDIGSPGTTTGPVALSFLQQPASRTVNPGDQTTLTASVQGLPRGRYQWTFNGDILPDAHGSSLTLTNVQSGQAGQYRVVVSNGLQTITCTNAQVSITGGGVAPNVLTPPQSQTIFIGQSATFAVAASGAPQPVYQWRFNGAPLPGETNLQLTVNNVTTNQAGTYSVIVSNTASTVVAAATLTVTRRPKLVITEIMSSEAGGVAGHEDWWELSNLDDFAVDLFGYRFDDSSATLGASVRITNSVVIAPGESVVFVEKMTPAAFRSWWGTNLSANTKIISYTTSGISFSSAGDAVVLWNAGTAGDGDFLTNVVFSTATAGTSFGYDRGTDIFGGLSQAGLNGAFVAAENGDIGSPGRMANPPAAPLLSAASLGAQFQLTCATENGAHYAAQFKNSLTETNWQTLTNFIGTGAIITVTDPVATGSQRFYRVTAQL